IERRRMAISNPLARLIRAAIAFLRGHRQESLTLLAAAEEGFTAAGMGLYAAAARRRRGQLLGGEEEKELAAAADAIMSAQDVRNPARIAAVLAPGFPD